MNTRRDFLIYSSILTTGVLALKPLKTFAGLGSPKKEITILHSPDFENSISRKFINGLQSRLILVNPVEKRLQIKGSHFDESVDFDKSNFKIIHHQNIQIGFINTCNFKENIFSKTNAIAHFLKNEKNCNLVICLSELGYSLKNNLDEKSLAARSNCIDIIISGHPENFCKHPSIILNSNGQEVIINNSIDKSFGLGKISMTFNENGYKNNIDFM